MWPPTGWQVVVRLLAGEGATVGRPGQFEEWAGRVLREGIGIGAVFLVYRRHGAAPERARDLAEEAVQEALARAARIPNVVARVEDSFDYFCNWVRRVAINHARSTLRRERRGRQLAEGEDVEAPPTDPPEHVQVVRAFLEQLTQEERDLLMLAHEEKVSLDELAERFLVPDGRTENARRLAIWSRRRHIRERLRQWLEDNGLVSGGGPTSPT
jgi:RNA polymerase sigma factor (sigma-70 family)